MVLAAEIEQNDPNLWTGCGTQVKIVRGNRKSLISIRPVCRLAGRGLDGNTHAPLVSLAVRLTSSPSGHLDYPSAANITLAINGTPGPCSILEVEINP